MLQSMREMAKSWVFKSLMILLVVSFAIWGIGDMFRGNPNQREVARIGRVSVQAQALEQRFQMDFAKARESFGPDLTAEMARKMGLLDRSLTNMIQEYLFDQEARRVGLVVGDHIILDKLLRQPELRDEKGNFNAQLWHRILGKMGVTERMFLDHEERQTAREVLISSLMLGAHAPKIAVDSLYQARGAKRLLEVVTLAHDSIKDIKEPDEETLKAYHAAHEAAFVAPEFRQVTVAVFEAESLKKDLVISDEDLKAAYEARKDSLMQPEARDFVQVVLQDEEKAKSLAEDAQKVGGLAKAAKAKGLTPITMKKITEKTVLPDLYTSLFSLEKGQVSGALKSSLGWHVVELQSVDKGGLPPLTELRESLMATLRDERLGDNVARVINQWDDALAGGQNLEEIADTLKLRLTRIVALDRDGRDPVGKEVKDLPAKEILLQAAFETGNGETSQVLDDGQGRYYAVRVDQVTPSHPLSFQEVEPRLKEAWLKEKRKERAIAVAEDMAKSLREGAKASSLALREGVEVRLSKPISILEDSDKAIPPSAMNDVLKMKRGDVTTADGGDRHYILRMSEIVPVNPDKPDSARIKVSDYLQEALGYNYIQQYDLYLRKVFPVRVDQKVLANLKSRGDDVGQ